MKNYVISLVALFLLANCAVYKASDVSGAKPEDIAQCGSKDCFLGLGSQVLESKNLANGGSEVIYKVKRKTGHVARAFVHGVADVFTLGIWEVIGTPMEGYLSDSDFIVFKVAYKPNGDVEKISIQGAQD